MDGLKFGNIPIIFGLQFTPLKTKVEEKWKIIYTNLLWLSSYFRLDIFNVWTKLV